MAITPAVSLIRKPTFAQRLLRNARSIDMLFVAHRPEAQGLLNFIKTIYVPRLLEEYLMCKVNIDSQNGEHLLKPLLAIKFNDMSEIKIEDCSQVSYDQMIKRIDKHCKRVELMSQN